MPFDPLPPVAAWQHEHARLGFEVVLPSPIGAGWRLAGTTTAVEDGQAWVVRWAVDVDERWATVAADAWSTSAGGERHVRLDADGPGRWRVDGEPRPDLDGCPDVDLEASACTNTIPVHRLGLAVGEGAEAPAAYVRALDLAVERLDQTYRRLPDGGAGPRYAYAGPRFGYDDVLAYDRSGLVVAYPGLARRVA